MATDPRSWRDAVLDGLRRYAARHGPIIDRQRLLAEELSRVGAATDTRGDTPGQTLSRVLQELRDEGLLLFVTPGRYLLAEQPVDIEALELPEQTIDEAIRAGRLRLGQLPATDTVAQRRLRRGQERLRRLALLNYRCTCAFCDVSEEPLLVASHIARWADCPSGRGDLANVLCLCRFHDPLFELGYFTLGDHLEIIPRYQGHSAAVRSVLRSTGPFRHPVAHPPGLDYLAAHRSRVTRT